MSSNMSAVDLLKLGNQGRIEPVLNVYWPYILGTVFGMGTAAMMNFGTRRPIFSGIQKHVISVAGWCVALNYVQKKREDYLAEKDAVLRHYIELHPDDFPTPERKKLANVLEPWTPIR